MQLTAFVIAWPTGDCFNSSEFSSFIKRQRSGTILFSSSSASSMDGYSSTLHFISDLINLAAVFTILLHSLVLSFISFIDFSMMNCAVPSKYTTLALPSICTIDINILFLASSFLFASLNKPHVNLPPLLFLE